VMRVTTPARAAERHAKFVAGRDASRSAELETPPSRTRREMQLEVSRRLGPVMESRIHRGFEVSEQQGRHDEVEVEAVMMEGGSCGGDGEMEEDGDDGGNDDEDGECSAAARMLAKLTMGGEGATEERDDVCELLGGERGVRRLMRHDSLGDEAGAAARHRRHDDSDSGRDSGSDVGSDEDSDDGEGGGDAPTARKRKHGKRDKRASGKQRQLAAAAAAKIESAAASEGMELETPKET